MPEITAPDAAASSVITGVPARGGVGALRSCLVHDAVDLALQDCALTLVAAECRGPLQFGVGFAAAAEADKQFPAYAHP